jgi:hypothetical protein
LQENPLLGQMIPLPGQFTLANLEFLIEHSHIQQKLIKQSIDFSSIVGDFQQQIVNLVGSLSRP